MIGSVVRETRSKDVRERNAGQKRVLYTYDNKVQFRGQTGRAWERNLRGNWDINMIFMRRQMIWKVQ